MEDMEILGFEYSLEDDCLHAKMAYRGLLCSIAVRDADRVWFCLKALLRSSAGISRSFWPPNKSERCQERARHLKSRFSILETSPLNSRKMRDHFDHFDERLDKWMKANPGFRRGGVNFQKHTMLPLNAPHFGFFDAPTMTVVFLNSTFEIRPVMKAIEKLSARVEKDIPQLMKIVGKREKEREPRSS